MKKRIKKINKYILLSVMTLVVMVFGYIANIQKSNTDGAITKVNKGGFLDNDYTNYYVKNWLVTGYENDDIVRIYMKNPNTSSDDYIEDNAGWCLRKGATLYGKGQGKSPESYIVSSGDARGYVDKGTAIPDFILYNLVRNGTEVKDEEIEFYKKRLGIEGNSKDDIFAGEQYLIWTYTNSDQGYTKSNAVSNQILATANANSSYTRDMDNSISLSKKDDSKCDATNNTFGLFSASNEGNLYVDYKVKISTDGSNFLDVSNYTAYTAEGTAIDNLNTYNGDFYIQTSDANNSNATLKIEQIHYTTEAKYYDTQQGHQPILYIDRNRVPLEVSSTVEGKAGGYHLNVVKKSSQDYEGITDESQVNLDDKSTGVGGATFTLTQQVYTASGRSEATSKTVTTEEGKASESVFGDTEIVEEGVGEDKHDIYTIEETSVPDGYLPIDLKGITFNVYKKTDGNTYKIDYVRINNAEGKEIGRASSGTGTTGKKVLDIDGNGTWDLGLEVADDGIALCITVINEPKEGDFKIKLVKYEQGSSKKLEGAVFNVNIVDNNGKTVLNKSQKTNSLGEINYSLTIEDKDLTYDVTVTETTPPPGYIGFEDPIKFKATTTFDEENHKYKLVAEGNIKDKTGDGYELSNAKKVEVNENDILIEAENRTTSIDIHKGVKTVENQDSGYYAVAEKIKELEEKQKKEDEETEKKYKDEKTSEEYTEIELEDIYHDWVVETTIPESVDKYKRYVVTDPVDTTKLDFSGTDRVKVELIGSDGKVKETLKLDDDYKVEYDESTSTLKVTYIDEKDDTFHGTFLSSENVEKNSDLVGSRIRITFNTTFKVNPETGKLVVLEGAITNAENQATLKYDNGNGEDAEKKSEIPEVHTGAVSVFKYEDTNGNGKHDEGEKALEGAEFKIALSEEDAKNGKFIKIDGKELTAVSNKDGIATFIGLSFGGDAMDSNELTSDEFTGAPVYEYDWENASKDYYIVETKSPAGYEKLNDAIKVTISKHSSEIIDLTDKINEMESVANRPLKFDLALRKWVTHAIVTENGKTVVYETGHHAEDDPEAVVKVDLKKSKLNQVKVQFKYSIRVTNEGEIAGEAREITDYIPAGLKFVQEDNPNWTTTSDERVVKTRLLEGVTLEPGESAEVEILLTWINGENTMGVMTNTAEISEDYNEYGVHDIDSTPNNKVTGEDDIDDAPVMLTVKTGSEVIAYTSLGVSFIAIITLGGVQIKRKIC